MLAKIPKKKRGSPTSFKKLVQYIARSEKHDAVSRNEDVLAHTVDTELQSVGNTPCFHNCASINTAYQEMVAVARNNTKVEDPVYHLILSWPDSDMPSNEEIRQACMDTLHEMGFDGHQYVIAIHHDTDNTHAHIAANRVHPETFKVVEKYNDYYRLDYIMRQLEIKNNWTREVGHYVIRDKNGSVFIDKATKKDRPNSRDHDDNVPDKATLLEVYSGHQSLHRYIKDNATSDIKQFFASKGHKEWDQLHAMLGQYGVSLVPYGQGFVIQVEEGDTITSVKASAIDSRLGKVKLEALLGDYVKPSASVASSMRYDKNAQPSHLSARDQMRQVRAQARRDLRQRYRDEKAQHMPATLDPALVSDRFKELHRWAKDSKQRNYELTPNRDTRLAANGVVAFVLSKELNKLKLDLREERNAIKFGEGRFPTYREWVHVQADMGDKAAQSQLRGWQYRDMRQESQNKMTQTPKN